MRAKATSCALALFALGVALEPAMPAQANEPTESKTIAARDAFVRRIDDFVSALAERARPRETLRGVVTGIDERNDRLTARLASNATSDFKVQDGLVFDAVHTGDAVELTIENIAGAKTIVGLSIE